MKLGIFPPIVIHRGDEQGERAVEISEIVFPYLPEGKSPPDDDLISSLHSRVHDCQLRRVPKGLLRLLDLESGLRDAFRQALAISAPRFHS